MDLEKQAQIVDSIHDTLSEFVGQKLRVRANMGRSKIVESEGVLIQVHPQLFILEVQRKRGAKARQSYQRSKKTQNLILCHFHRLTRPFYTTF